MSADDLLRRLNKNRIPSNAAKDRVRRMVAREIDSPEMLPVFERKLQPSAAMKDKIWDRVLTRIEAPVSTPIFGTIRHLLEVEQEAQNRIYRRIVDRLTNRTSSVGGLMPVKWVASFAVFALLIRMSPALFLAPSTQAGSDVRLLPTDGNVSVSIAGLWQEMSDELILEAGMRIRTYEGEASVVYHDDAVLRLGENTVMAMHDVTDSFDSAPEAVPTASLLEGSLWVQGLISGTSRGLTVALPHGYVTVNEGSVSLTVDEEGNVEVAVWDRRAIVSHEGQELTLVAGERTDMRSNSALLVKKIVPERFHADWQKQNLARDAVHRRHIAHMQQERRAAQAGILPTSSFYSVKRAAEEMDVLMTLTEEDRIQKRLEQAHTRLNEAAALLQEGGSADEIASALDQYKQTLLSLQSESDSPVVSQFLIRQSVEKSYADLVASLPGDESYALKKVVLEATAGLSDSVINIASTQEVLFADALDRLTMAVDAGGPEDVRAQWLAFQPFLAMLEEDSLEGSKLSVEVAKEAKASLERLALALSEEDVIASVDPDLQEDILAYLPDSPDDLRPVVLSDEEVQNVVQGIMDRIYVYGMPQSRHNQLRVELAAIEGHEEEGRFLRSLYSQLPARSRLTEFVRKEIVRLKWDKASESIIVQEQILDEDSEQTNI